eukprot:4804139-Amphidinium_carterae.1
MELVVLWKTLVVVSTTLNEAIPLAIQFLSHRMRSVNGVLPQSEIASGCWAHSNWRSRDSSPATGLRKVSNGTNEEVEHKRWSASEWQDSQ